MKTAFLAPNNFSVLSLKKAFFENFVLHGPQGEKRRETNEKHGSAERGGRRGKWNRGVTVCLRFKYSGKTGR